MPPDSLIVRRPDRWPLAGTRSTHRRLRTWCGVATAATFFLIALGALVRATGSGDACPDWPTCFGRWVPPLETRVLIEYAHRVTAFVVVVLIAVAAVVAGRWYRREPRVMRPVLTAVALVLVQAALGGLVVLRELRALDVTVHLGTAMLLVGSLVLATVASASLAAARRRPTRFTWLARAAAGGVFALILVGATVRAEGAGLAFADWPLMGGGLLPDLRQPAAAFHFAHRALALVVGVLVLWVAVWAWREPAPEPWLKVTATAGAALFVAQMLVGAAAVWTRLSPLAVVAHVILSALIWAASVATASISRVCWIGAKRPLAVEEAA